MTPTPEAVREQYVQVELLNGATLTMPADAAPDFVAELGGAIRALTDSEWQHLLTALRTVAAG
jgi:hypothetical protein